MAENTPYPLGRMNFLVTVADINGVAVFAEILGVEAAVGEIEFRQGNSNSMVPVKMPEHVKHGNVTLKRGYTQDNAIAGWIASSTSESGQTFKFYDITIELIDISDNTSWQATACHGRGPAWVLKNAWISKYNAPDLNSTSREAAIEWLELAYEELLIQG